MTPIDERLQALAEQAADAARHTGVPAIGAWSAYVDAVRAAVNVIRALEVADLVYLRGLSLREVADTVTRQRGHRVSFQAVGEWLARHGPTEYAVVRADGGTHHVEWVPVTSASIGTRRHLAALAAAGHRIAPARWQITRDSAVCATDLWNRLAP